VTFLQNNTLRPGVAKNSWYYAIRADGTKISYQKGPLETIEIIKNKI